MSQKNPNSSGINKNWKPPQETGAEDAVDYFINGIKNNNRTILSEALTLIESTTKDPAFILQLLDGVYTTSKTTLRIGISGSPGAGKSTFINALGEHLVGLGKKVAVLTVDPSSEITKGSILGDKTRMYNLIQNPHVYIRPTPSSNFLGGVASTTKESILLCEAAGYDIILIETVGVGQSETLVKNMVDLFCLILLPGAGDELQGIKKGIVEMSDIFIINKADGDRELLAKESKKFYKNAIHLGSAFANVDKEVLTCSSTEQIGFTKIWKTITTIRQHRKDNNSFDDNRAKQNQNWLRQKKEAIKVQHLKGLLEDISTQDDEKNEQMFKSLIDFNTEIKAKITQLKNQLKN